MIVAAMGNHVEMLEFLIERKANVNCTDKDGCTALTIACRNGLYDIVIALLDAGAYINIQVKNSQLDRSHEHEVTVWIFIG